MAVPTLLLSYLLHHIYKNKDKKEAKESSEEASLKLLNKTPMNDLIKLIETICNTCRKV
ncbi:hypothetical protein [Desulfovibrio litoralis]|nr:hypothetical protein [Desulfovibrio litoralis]